MDMLSLDCGQGITVEDDHPIWSDDSHDGTWMDSYSEEEVSEGESEDVALSRCSSDGGRNYGRVWVRHDAEDAGDWYEKGRYSLTGSDSDDTMSFESTYPSSSPLLNNFDVEVETESKEYPPYYQKIHLRYANIQVLPIHTFCVTHTCTHTQSGHTKKRPVIISSSSTDEDEGNTQNNEAASGTVIFKDYLYTYFMQHMYMYIRIHTHED